MFTYNIVVAGNENSVDDISSKVIGYLQRDNSNIGIKREKLSKQYVNYKTNLYPLPRAVTSSISKINEKDSNSDIVNRLPQVISTDEAIDIFRLPIGSKNILAGLPINFADTTIRKYKENVINKGDLSLGFLKNSMGRRSYGTV